MPQSSPRQRKTTGRVMHEFNHGELKSGPGGKGGKVNSRRQAVAIALKEAGASKYESKQKNKRNLAKTERKEARGETYQPGARGQIAWGHPWAPRKQPCYGRQERHQKNYAQQQGREVTRPDTREAPPGNRSTAVPRPVTSRVARR